MHVIWILFRKFSVVFTLFNIIWIVLPWLYCNFLAPFIFGCAIDFKKYGEWAVVTGASDGIGKEIAKQLAQRGLNIVLISRTLSKLKSVAEELEEKYKVRTLVIDVDFKQGLPVYEKIKPHLEQLDIGVLVNNVGITAPNLEMFHEAALLDNFLWDILACNVLSVTFMTKLVIQSMVDKKKGLVLNVSSLAGSMRISSNIYDATKAFVDRFTTNLQLEYHDHGVDFYAFKPGLVETNLAKLTMGPIFKPSAKRYVRSAFRYLGRDVLTIGYIPHFIMYWYLKIAGEVYFPWIYDKGTMAYFNRQRNLRLKTVVSSESGK